VFTEVFNFLFKYPPLVFEQGRFVFGASRTMSIVAVAAAIAAVYVLWTYRKLNAIPRRDRIVLLGLRVGLFALVLFALMRPTLLLKIAVPQQNFVGILLDDSRSMQITDQNGKPRADFVKEQFGQVDSPLLSALGKRFQLRIFRFSSQGERLQSSTDLAFAGTASRYSEAMNRARDELSGLPVAGMVLVGDGADTSQTTMDESIAGLKAQGMPVFSVGVGKDRLARDVQVTRAETPRRTLKGSNLVVDVVVAQTGYAGQKVPLVVEDAGRIVNRQEITLPRDGEAATFHVRFLATETGPRQFRFKIPVQGNEEVAENNQRDALIEVDDRRERILYLEGEVRPEMKFIFNASKLDRNLSLVVLQRTATDKYYRLGVDSGEELQAGFPTTRAELFGYRGVVLGSAEASAFTIEQQRMLADFVDVRGGGLIALGGRSSFGEGGWTGTPLAAALPVAVDFPARTRGNDQVDELIVRPTPVGASHPTTQIVDSNEAELAAKWREMPPVTSVNAVKQAKPGATVLLTGMDQNGDNGQIVLAHQRYGRGKSMVFTPQDSWLWRMHAKMPLTDTTHHIFWQRMLRWLVDGVPDKVMVSATPDKVQKGEPVTLSADIVDPDYKGINNGRITARVTSPSGKTEEVPMEWTVKREGEYTGRFTPDEDGLYKVRVGGTHDVQDVGAGEMTMRVAPSDAEYFDAAMRAPLLSRISEETGGRFYRADNTKDLVDAITYSGRGVTVTEDRELWDMPIILLLALGLMASEWGYRRSRGLA
jgi:uncharacterized membrane protein